MVFAFNNRTTCLTIAAVCGQCGLEPVSRGQIYMFGDGAARLPRCIERSLFFCQFLVAVLILVSVSTPSFASDDEGWPFVRGPCFDGHSAEKGFTTIGPKQAPPVLWQRNPGQGYSAFAAKSDRVYTQAQNMTGQ